MAFWQIDPATATDPAVVELAPGEARTLTLDTARYGGIGRRILAVTLVDLDTGRAVALPAPSLAGGVIGQAVRLAEPGDYELRWSWIVDALNKPSKVTIIRCVGR